MRKSNFGGQRLGSFKMVDLLETGSLPSSSIPTLGGVQEMKGVYSVVIGVFEVLKVVDWVLDPASGQEGLSNVIVLAEDNEDLLGRVELGVFFPESFDSLLGSLVHLVLRQVFDLLAFVDQLEDLLCLVCALFEDGVIGCLHELASVALASLEALLQDHNKGVLSVLEEAQQSGLFFFVRLHVGVNHEVPKTALSFLELLVAQLGKHVISELLLFK